MVGWSACLTTDQEVAGSIPGIYTILKNGLAWNEVNQASSGELGSYLIEK